jgi:hypothetical protein
MASYTSAVSFGLQLKSGNPCERFIAPYSVASLDIVVNIVVPKLGNLLEICPGKFGIINS